MLSKVIMFELVCKQFCTDELPYIRERLYRNVESSPCCILNTLADFLKEKENEITLLKCSSFFVVKKEREILYR